MRRLIGTSSGVRIARMPWPAVEDNTLLVRVSHSLISAGTELAPYRAQAAAAKAPPVRRALARAMTLASYARLAARHPDKAVAKIGRIARNAMLQSRAAVVGETASDLGDQGWTLGYSATGQVIAVGAGCAGFAVGDRVSCGGAGVANHADVICVPVNLACRLPASVPAEAGAFVTVGAIALQGVRRSGAEIGDVVAVIGLGLLGLLSVQLLKATGCRVVGFDPDSARTDRARAMGLESASSDETDFLARVRDLSAGWGADRVLICAASQSSRPANLALDAIRRKGVAVVVGDVGMTIERPAFYSKEADFLISTSYGPGRYDPDYELRGHDYPLPYVRWTLQRNMAAVAALMEAGRLDTGALLDRIVPIDQAPAAYGELARQAAPLAVLLSYGDGDGAADEGAAGRLALRGAPATAAGDSRFALVGAGAFGQSVLLPALRAEGLVLADVVSADGVRGGNLARQEGTGQVSASVAASLAGADAPSLYVMATRHDRHAGDVIRCLQAGRHVFVEKPLALNWDDLDAVAAAVETAPGDPLLMIGFNRRFAPAMQALAGALADRRGPLVMHYRMNGGRIASTHWIQTAEGGGRNIGEACHIYDVFRFLAGQPLASVQAASIDPGASDWLRNDNFAATLQYSDGSLGNLVYSALGPKTGLPKERLEVFCDGEAYILDDFRSLTRAGDGAVLWQGAVDKGHREEIRRFAAALRGEADAPIPVSELIETSAAALLVEDQIFGRESPL
jgi:predicted dehydrogenase/threonine dehydrogenase-like Zn-dependent dehydrogenase